MVCKPLAALLAESVAREELKFFGEADRQIKRSIQLPHSNKLLFVNFIIGPMKIAVEIK